MPSSVKTTVKHTDCTYNYYNDRYFENRKTFNCSVWNEIKNWIVPDSLLCRQTHTNPQAGSTLILTRTSWSSKEAKQLLIFIIENACMLGAIASQWQAVLWFKKCLLGRNWFFWRG